MLNWKHFVFAFFAATGVTAFLAVIANEIEIQTSDLKELRDRNSAKSRAAKAAQASPLERQAA